MNIFIMLLLTILQLLLLFQSVGTIVKKIEALKKENRNIKNKVEELESKYNILINSK